MKTFPQCDLWQDSFNQSHPAAQCLSVGRESWVHRPFATEWSPQSALPAGVPPHGFDGKMPSSPIANLRAWATFPRWVGGVRPPPLNFCSVLGFQTSLPFSFHLAELPSGCLLLYFQDRKEQGEAGVCHPVQAGLTHIIFM